MMNLPHLHRSRISKAIVDAGLASSFAEAETRLDAVALCVAVGPDQVSTRAGQAAALTAVVTARKCFGRVTLALNATEVAMVAPLRASQEFAEAARRLGAHVTREIPATSTHVLQIGFAAANNPDLWTIHAWWDRWLSGARVQPPGPLRDSRLGLAGVFAGSLAVRQVFATVLHGFDTRPREVTISLWQPWNPNTDPGPEQFTAPNHLWLAGLGHLGQAFVWSLLWLPYRSERRMVIQDDQHIGIENEPTGVLVLPGDVGRRKTRVVDDWLEPAGWSTEMIERRHRGDIALTSQDPSLLLAGLDDVEPRHLLAKAGFAYMVDAGIGSGAHDFEGLQVRTIPKGADVDRLWESPRPQRNLDKLLATEAYQTADRAAKANGACGAYELAEASVATPFVGAATAALTIAQLVRLTSMQSGAALLQLSLAAPEMIIDGGLSVAPRAFLGGEEIDLQAGD